MKFTLLKFLRHWDKHTPGDVAGFTSDIAERLVKGKIAEVHKPAALVAGEADGVGADGATSSPDAAGSAIDNTPGAAVISDATNGAVADQAVVPGGTVDNGGAANALTGAGSTVVDTGQQDAAANQPAASAKGEKPKLKGK